MAGPTKNAKVASKNNPSSRGAKVKMYFKNEEVIPVKYIGTPIGKGSYMAISLASNGALVLDENGNPYNWDLAQRLSS